MPTLHPVWGLVAARSFSTAKSRIARGIGGAAGELARVMLERVLAATVPAVDRIVVATDGDDVAAVAREYGAEVVRDRAWGLAGVVDDALAEIAARGASAAIVLMADLPLVEAEDVEALRRALERADVVIAPDRVAMGTNALGVRLPAGATCFGNEDSFRRHVAAAAGKRVEIVRTRGLAFDLDQPEDLRLIEIRSRANAKRGSRVSAG